MPMLFQKTETENKEPASIRRERTPTHRMEWQIAALLLTALFVMWCGLYAITAYECNEHYRNCTLNNIVLWTPPVIILAGTITYSSIYFVGMYHEAQRKRLANAIDEHYDYRKLDRVLENRLMDIANQLSVSYGSAEIDTWSPTNNSTSNSTNVGPPTIEGNKENNNRKIDRSAFLDVLDKE